MSNRVYLLAPPVLLALLAPLGACGPRAGSSGASTPAIQITELGAGMRVVDVVGLSRRDFDAMSRVAAGEWPSIFHIHVAGGSNDQGLPSMSGAYSVFGDRIRFTPDFPLDARLAYKVVFTGPGTMSLKLSIPATVITPQAASTRVTDLFPPDTLFENHLRLYIHFSAPMSNRPPEKAIRLLDDRGKDVEDPFLPIDVHLWNEDRTRYTVLFDPGRVKRGILPNMEKGRALERGRTYTLVVDREWRDAEGRPLADTLKREFRVVPEVLAPIAPAEWLLEVPRAGTRDPLLVRFRRTLDHALAERVIFVTTTAGRTLEGSVRIDPAATFWSFAPRALWLPGEYRLRALSELEDPSGNRIGRAFDYDAARAGSTFAPGATADKEASADRHAEASLPFTIR